MVGVVVDGDLVAVPEPVVAEAEVERRDTEVEPVAPEPLSVAALEPELVSEPEPAGKAAVFERVIEVVMGIVAPGVVADPTVVMVDVRDVRMASHVGHAPPFHRRRRPMGRNVSATEAAAAAATALGKGGLRNDQKNDEHAKRCPHVSSASQDGKGSAAPICNLNSEICHLTIDLCAHVRADVASACA